jgi:catechol 2,3-dioxygenase-like lactoylglutathione lyase family enzyme
VTELLDGPYSHVALVVADLDAAIASLGPALGLTWASIRVVDVGVAELRLSYSQQGPPYLELLEASGRFPTAEPGLHHIGYWSNDLAENRDTLVRAGMRVVLDGMLFGRSFVYLDAGDRLLIELTDAKRRPAILRWISGADEPHEREQAPC